MPFSCISKQPVYATCNKKPLQFEARHRSNQFLANAKHDGLSCGVSMAALELPQPGSAWQFGSSGLGGFKTRGKKKQQGPEIVPISLAKNSSWILFPVSKHVWSESLVGRVLYYMPYVNVNGHSITIQIHKQIWQETGNPSFLLHFFAVDMRLTLQYSAYHDIMQKYHDQLVLFDNYPTYSSEDPNPLASLLNNLPIGSTTLHPCTTTQWPMERSVQSDDHKDRQRPETFGGAFWFLCLANTLGFALISHQVTIIGRDVHIVRITGFVWLDSMFVFLHWPLIYRFQQRVGKTALEHVQLIW